MIQPGLIPTAGAVGGWEAQRSAARMEAIFNASSASSVVSSAASSVSGRVFVALAARHGGTVELGRNLSDISLDIMHVAILTSAVLASLACWGQGECHGHGSGDQARGQEALNHLISDQTFIRRERGSRVVFVY